jgi:hypothetical protein
VNVICRFVIPERERAPAFTLCVPETAEFLAITNEDGRAVISMLCSTEDPAHQREFRLLPHGVVLPVSCTGASFRGMIQLSSPDNWAQTLPYYLFETTPRVVHARSACTFNLCTCVKSGLATVVAGCFVHDVCQCAELEPDDEMPCLRCRRAGLPRANAMPEMPGPDRST